MSFSLFDLDYTKQPDNYDAQASGAFVSVLQGITTSETKIADYLSRDLGFSAIQSRNKGILAAMGNPKDQLNNYHAALDVLLGKAAVIYKDAFDKLKTLGLSDKRAQEAAKNKAASFFQHERMILDVEYPIANDINTLASASAKTNIRV